jgi:16S rRNA (cytosine967-C5)-methyltransferase
VNDLARDRAMEAVARNAAAFPRLEATAVSDVGLDPRDAGLMHAIVDQVAKRWLTLGYLLESKLSKPLSGMEPEVRAALLVGAAQIVLLDRVPGYAAINHAVDWVKWRVRAGAGGLVNAVLRRVEEMVEGRGGGVPGGDQAVQPPAPPRRLFDEAIDELMLPDGTARVIRTISLPQDRLRRLAIASGVPEALLRRFASQFGDDEAARLALHASSDAPVVLNLSACGSGVLDSHPELLTAHAAEGHAVFVGPHAELAPLLARTGAWVQDASSSLAVMRLAEYAREHRVSMNTVADLCAGQGTKTRQMSVALPDATVVATDTDERRRAVLRTSFEGHPRVKVIEPTDWGAFSGACDAVLLDVPCSNTGVLARRPEARHRHDDRSIGELLEIQRQILRQGRGLLAARPGACLIYATCSLDDRENEEMVLWAERELDLRVVDDGLQLPTGGGALPASQWRDGAFSAVLVAN